MGLGFALGLALVCATTDGDARADERPAAQESLRFGDELRGMGEPGRAVHEYLRSLSFARWDSSEVARAALRNVAVAALEDHDYELAVRWPRVAREHGLRGTAVSELDLFASTALLRQSHPEQALATLQAPGEDAVDSSLADRRAFLEGIARLQLGQWLDASHAFGRVPARSSLASAATQYQTRALDGRKLRSRSPGLARWLSIVPGLGYLYCGLPQTAAAALIVTGIFGESTREAFRHDQNTLGGFLTAFSVSWYAGSIYGAGESAQRMNRYQRTQFLIGFTY